MQVSSCKKLGFSPPLVLKVLRLAFAGKTPNAHPKRGMLETDRETTKAAPAPEQARHEDPSEPPSPEEIEKTNLVMY